MSSSPIRIKVLWIHLIILQKACQVFFTRPQDLKALHTAGFICENEAFTHIEHIRVIKKSLYTLGMYRLLISIGVTSW